MSYDVECPVCDRKAPSTASVCQYCGADLKMASFDELEEVAQAVASGKASANSEPRPTNPSEPKQEATSRPAASKEPTTPEPTSQPQVTPLEEKAQEAAHAEKAKEEKKEDEGKHGLGRLFGKKKK